MGALWISLHRYVKNAKLDKGQRSGHTESHKDVQCLEAGGAEGRWSKGKDFRRGVGGVREQSERQQGLKQVSM